MGLDWHIAHFLVPSNGENDICLPFFIASHLPDDLCGRFDRKKTTPSADKGEHEFGMNSRIQISTVLGKKVTNACLRQRSVAHSSQTQSRSVTHTDNYASRCSILVLFPLAIQILLLTIKNSTGFISLPSVCFMKRH